MFEDNFPKFIRKRLEMRKVMMDGWDYTGPGNFNFEISIEMEKSYNIRDTLNIDSGEGVSELLCWLVKGHLK